MDTLGDQAAHGAHGVLRLKDATAHHCPAGLIVMDLGRINNRDFQTRLAGLQAGGNGNPCRATANNDHLITGVAGVGWRFATVRNTPHNTCHVIASRFGLAQNIGHAQPVGLRQGPKRCGPCTGAAIGQHRTRKFRHQPVKGCGVLIADFARHDRQIGHFKAELFRRGLDLVKGGLIRTFAVRSVANDGSETLFLDCWQIGNHHL